MQRKIKLYVIMITTVNILIYVSQNSFSKCIWTLTLELNFLIENHPNKLGHVEDEDGYLRKDFYLDSNLFNKEMQKRKVVCEGCRKYVKNYDCDN